MLKISFLGYGNLAKAIVQGAIKAGVIEPSQLLISSPSYNQGAPCPYAVSKNNKEAAKEGNILFLAAKPNQIESICNEISTEVDETKLIVSVAAGKTTAAIAQSLNCSRIPIIRTMPNTPVAVGHGVTGFYSNAFVTTEQSAFITKMFKAIGIVEAVTDENDIDLITATSGSGPAYFMYLAEAMVNAAVERGLSQEQAQRIVKQTLYGTGALLNNTPETFALKRAQVTSKRGTTAAGIACLEKTDFMQLIDSVIDAAHRRAQEMSGSEPDTCSSKFFTK